MIPDYLPPIANHLWQSTLFAGLMAMFTLAFRRNRAHVRYALWLAASLKFLVPFSLLIAVGGQFHWRNAPAIPLPVAAAVQDFGQPVQPPFFTGMLAPATAPEAPLISILLIAAWSIGCAFVLIRWFLRWRRLLIASRHAASWPIDAPVPVMSCCSQLEPGVFGILRPVVLLPEGIQDRLTPGEVSGILAHELCHVRRRDNLTAAIHMVVEAIFWFHPLVWWLSARMLDERERACDEEVVRMGSEPAVYAGGILNVCRFYVESQLACAAGVTGADLEKRIEAIMTNRVLSNLTLAKTLLLASAAIAVVGAPLFIGLVGTRHVHAQGADDADLKFDVATIKPAKGGGGKAGLDFPAGGGLQIATITLRHLITFAYDVPDYQVSGGPSWISSESYNIVAKPEHPEGPGDVSHLSLMQQRTQWDRARARTRALLAERFQLVTHTETKEGTVYALVIAKGGPKLLESKDTEGNSSTMRNQTEINARRGTTEMLAFLLSNWLRQPFVDRTGLTGKYDYKLTYGHDPAGTTGGAFPNAGPMDADSPDASGPSIFTALQEQLGLKIESQKGPVKVIVIDHVEKPSAN